MAGRSVVGRSASLCDVLSTGADCQLVFEGGEQVPGHSQILRAWSGVLRHALEAAQPVKATDTSSVCRSSTITHHDAAADELWIQATSIPVPGSTKEEWLQVAAFFYPVIPTPQVTWHNLEALLVLGAKLDIPAVLCRAGLFIESHMCLLDMAENGSRFVWRWLALTDQAGLDDVCSLCIERAVQLDRASCGVQSRLLGLSSRALQRLVMDLALHPAGVGPDGRTPRESFSGPGVVYRLYHSPEVAAILDLPTP